MVRYQWQGTALSLNPAGLETHPRARQTGSVAIDGDPIVSKDVGTLPVSY